MNDKLVLKRIILFYLIFALATFAFETWGIPALGMGGAIVFVIVMIPMATVMGIFGITDPYNKSHSYSIAANALLWAIPFALIYWRILVAKSKGIE
ncbi:MAG TPA: hypothetical protein VGO67_13415 [Verrucomicrobiae bacterium]